MEETFADAGVSITVTSLTDFISFAVGCATPFPSVQMFCAVCGDSSDVHDTSISRPLSSLNADVLAHRQANGTRRQLQVHWLAERSKRKRSKSAYEDRSFEKNHLLSQFFRTTLTQGPVLLNSRIDYGSNLHVWMYNLSNVDIGPRRIWTVLDKEIELYEHTEFTGAADSWLRTYLAFTKQSGLLITQDNFVYILRNVFLSQPPIRQNPGGDVEPIQESMKRISRKNLLKDLENQLIILFDASGSLLDASRVPIQLRHVGFANQSRAMQLFRKLAETSKLPTGVYADFFQFAEQYNAVLPGTLSSIGYAGAAVIVVSLLLIPEPVASLWVSFSIVSINIGILGFMTFWNVRLDFISMVTIVMSIGFCVDFAAHLAYNFAKVKYDS
ncbi:hypothetical protein OSTOST_17960 [Ostertagia ostertagi]